MNWEITDSSTQQKLGGKMRGLFNQAKNKLKKPNETTTLQKAPMTYDQSSISFSLIGGPLHSELLIAAASLKVGLSTKNVNL